MISPIIPKIVDANLFVVKDEVLAKLPADVAALATAAADALSDTIHALADGEVADAKQIEKIWKAFIGAHLTKYAGIILASGIEDKIKNEAVKKVMQLLLNPTLTSIQVLVDENTKDGDQLEDLWLDFIKDDKTLSVLLSLIFGGRK